jgi:catechol 2,3-dioxygenase-like lactoylglutathione lyase family enzyme
MIRGGAVVLGVADLSRSVRFYVETLGMKTVAETEGAFVIDAGEGFLIELRSGHTVSRATLKFYAKVPLAEAIAIYENRGVVFQRSEGAGSFTDPDGHELVLVADPT